MKPNHSLIDDEVVLMIYSKKFADLFWSKYQERLKDDPGVRREEIFDEMNNKYKKAMGEFRYSSYDSFRKRLK